MSDYIVIVKEHSKIFLGGPPLVKMATGEDSDDETLGGAQMHAEMSGLGEYLAEDERDALRLCREVISPPQLAQARPAAQPRADPPLLDPEELLGIASADLRRAVDDPRRDRRVVDGSRFEEFKPRYGSTLVCGWARSTATRSASSATTACSTPESAEKAAHFIQLCNQIDVPLLFLQNITGFMVGATSSRPASSRRARR